MHGSKLDKKCKKLIVLLSELRDAIDIQRVIGLNAEALASVGASGILFGYLQYLALESLAICFSKVFEPQRRNELNSIPGVLSSLPNLELSPRQKEQFRAFGRRYGNQTEPITAQAYLQEALDAFSSAHSDALGQLKEFRDTIGAHSDYAASLETLPSHAEFEALFEFSLDFYQLVAESIIPTGPATPPRRVGRTMLDLFKHLGIPDPTFELDPDRQASTPAAAQQGAESDTDK